MKILNEYRTHCIEFERLEEDNYFLSIGVTIRIKTNHLNCFFDNIWIEQEQINGFIEALRVLDEKREGQIQLSGMSPEAFQLTIQAIDKNGHLAVWVRIETHTYISDYTEILQSGFEIDPTSIPEIIVGLKRMMN